MSPALAHDEHADEHVHEHEEEPIDGVFTDLFAASREPPRWVVKDLIPAGLTFIGAPPKSGKSTITMAMALMVADFPCVAFPPFLREVPEPGRVMVFSAEATAGELLDMVEGGLRVKGEANGGIVICDDPFMWRLDDDDGLTQLLRWLVLRRPRLVIIDPLRDFHSLEEKDSGHMNRLLRPLQKWAKETASAVVIVHHVKKKQTGDGKEDEGYTPDDLRGTTALHGIADGVLMITPLPEGYIRLRAQFKRAAGYDKQFRLATYAHAESSSTERLGEVEQQVLRLLEDASQDDGFKKGVTDKWIHAQLRVAPGRLKEAVVALERNGLITKDLRGWKVRAQ